MLTEAVSKAGMSLNHCKSSTAWKWFAFDTVRVGMLAMQLAEACALVTLQSSMGDKRHKRLWHARKPRYL